MPKSTSPRLGISKTERYLEYSYQELVDGIEDLVSQIDPAGQGKMIVSSQAASDLKGTSYFLEVIFENAKNSLEMQIIHKGRTANYFRANNFDPDLEFQMPTPEVLAWLKRVAINLDFITETAPHRPASLIVTGKPATP